MASKEEVRPIGPVSYAGDFIQKSIFWIGLILIGIGYISKFRTFNSDLVMCKGLKKPVLSQESGSVKQIVRSECFSTVLISPSTPKAKIAWNAPGAVDVCFWKMNRCAAWMHINDGQIQEKSRKDIPSDYTAILLRGDPGEADIHLLR